MIPLDEFRAIGKRGKTVYLMVMFANGKWDKAHALSRATKFHGRNMVEKWLAKIQQYARDNPNDTLAIEARYILERI